ncbi:hypothetical protein [Flagellimonas flava]|uniref:hypothetical protein n=1 Tax=Flagellimonas flava TaxID=570519 RepID=UPI003D64CC28
MENFDKLKSDIVNATLKKIYRTKKPFLESPFEGLGVLLTYKFIMELDNGKKYGFSRDYIWEWDNSEKIVELKTKLRKEYKNKRILDLIKVDDIYFKMENDMVLHHKQAFGSELVFEKYSEYFDGKGELI